MGVPITNYTGTDAIRASLGVTDNEISDTMLVDQRLDIELLSDLAAWLPTHAAIFQDGAGTSATDSQKLQRDYLLVYCQWFCAGLVAQAQAAFLQEVSDGKMSVKRFQSLDLPGIEARAQGRQMRFKRLLQVASGGTASSTTFKFAGGVTPGYDPVNGV